MPAAKPCRDCPTGTRRKATYPGPRCATHHREVTQARKDAAHDRYLRETYNITKDQYKSILAAQGGCCAWCRRAKGIKKNLAVDHDHACCNGPRSCGKCVRGLLCGTCNKSLGHFRDEPSAIRRGASYLENPPAKQILNLRRS